MELGSWHFSNTLAVKVLPSSFSFTLNMSTQEILLAVWEWLYSFLRVIYWYLEALYKQFIPPPMKSIDGETILVTGAVGGIGKELCKHLVRSGSNIKLVLWDLNLPQLEKLAKELTAIGNGVKIFPFATDISTRENIEISSKLVKDRVGRVTIVFNNAGIAPIGNFLQLSNQDIEKTIQINLMSHFWILREFLPGMVVENHGRIVNICSIAGLRPGPFSFPYFSSKFAVNGYTDCLKIELEQFEYDGIHVSTVYPYFVKTPLIESLIPGKSASELPSSLQNILEPADVGRSIVDGMRREYEYIYLPSNIPIFNLIDYLIPMKLRKLMQSKYKTSFIYKDKEEQKRIETPYLVTIKKGGIAVGKKEEWK